MGSLQCSRGTYIRIYLTYLQSRPDLRTRHFVGMSLARMLRLVQGMVNLTERGFPDVVDVLGRSALETFALGLYVLCGGQSAYDHVRGAHIRERRALPDFSFEIPEWDHIKDVDAEWQGPTEKIKWEALITEHLPQLLDPDDQAGTSEFFDRLYQQSYRFGSMAGTHAGVGTVARHHIEGSDRLSVRQVGHTTDDGTASVVFAASLLAMFGSHVFEYFGLSPDRCDYLLKQLSTDPGLAFENGS